MKPQKHPQSLETWLSDNPLPDPFETESKEARGQILVVGGSAQVPGAPWLAGRAALHAGAGKLHVATTASTAIPLAVRLPEAKVTPLSEDAYGEIARANTATIQAARHSDGVLIGPGMGKHRATCRVVSDLLAVTCAGWVLDAGAILEAQEIASLAHPGVVTPHAGEMASATRLSREEVEADPLKVARSFAKEAGCVVVMKGVPTHVVAPDGLALAYLVEAPGLGTSGSGDVLAGLIAGLVARGATPLTAAAWGVWLHGMAGLELGRRVGPVGYLARDISPEVPRLMDAGVKEALPSRGSR